MRVYQPGELAPGGRCTLSSTAARHVGKVLRLRVGEPLTLFNGRGGEYQATVSRVDRQGVEVSIGAHQPIEREASLGVHLLQGVSRAARMDLAIQKAVELGVAAIHPVLTERSVVKLDQARGARRLAHWESVAIHACQQCGRNRLPQIGAAVGFEQALTEIEPDCGLMLAPGATTVLSNARIDSGSVHLLIGPEGGLSPAEAATAERTGYQPVNLGPRILRTETATIAALAILQARHGDLGE